MESTGFLHSNSGFAGQLNRKRLYSIIGLVILLLGIPLAVWLLQRAQIFAPKADVKPIELVMGDNSCVISTDPNKASCASFPIKLTSPLGPMVQSGSVCRSDNDCAAGDKCFNFQNYPGTCRPSDISCSAVITTACTTEQVQCVQAPCPPREICVDFPSPCHVPPGWTVGPRPSPSACATNATALDTTVVSNKEIKYTLTYPAGSKITKVDLPATAGYAFKVNDKTGASGAALNADLGAGTETVVITVTADAAKACAPFTINYNLTNNCGTTFPRFFGPGTTAAWGAVCQASPSPSPSPSPSAAPVCSTNATGLGNTVVSNRQITYTLTYPSTSKITRVALPATPGYAFNVNGQTAGSGAALNADLGAGAEAISITVTADANKACQPFTISYNLTNSCGTTFPRFFGPGTTAAWGTVCTNPTPTPTTGVSSGTDELGVNLQATGSSTNGAPVITFSNGARADTNNFNLYKNGQVLPYDFAGIYARPPTQQMKDTAIALGSQNAYYIQAKDGPLAGKKSNTVTITAPTSCAGAYSGTNLNDVFRKFISNASKAVTNFGATTVSAQTACTTNATALSSNVVSNKEITYSLTYPATSKITKVSFPATPGYAFKVNNQAGASGAALNADLGAGAETVAITVTADAAKACAPFTINYNLTNSCNTTFPRFLGPGSTGAWGAVCQTASPSPSASVAPPNTLLNGLLTYWNLDQAGATLTEPFGQKNGTATGTTSVAGRIDKGRSFSAATDKILTDTSSLGLSSMTTSAWIYVSGLGQGAEAIVNQWTNVGSWNMSLVNYNATTTPLNQDTGNPYLHFNSVAANCQGTNGYVYSNAALSLNSWHHVAASRDGGTGAIKLYVDGAPVASTGRADAPIVGGAICNQGMPIEIGMLSSGAFPFKGVIDEVGIWNRVLTDTEISALFNGGQGKTLVPGASPSPRPSPQGTLYYKLAESEADLQNAPAIPYSEHPTVTNFAFKDTNWGSKQIWVQFIGPNNTSTNEHISVDVIEPEPVITSLDCTMDISRKDLKLTLNGSLFGGTPGKVTANAKETQILAWNANQITATIKPTDNLEDGKLFKIVMTRADGKALPETTCLVNTSVLSLGARLFCREPGQFDVSAVKITLIDEGGNKVNEDVTIDKEGLIKGLKTKLQVGKKYAISVKAPNSLRRNAEFTAASGTNILTPEDNEVFVLPVGDIAPVILPDGKINTLDRSEIVRQWSTLGAGSNKTGDFNKDSKVNSIDWACMRYDFNKEDDAIPTKLSATPSPSGQPCPTPPVCPAGKTLVHGDPQEPGLCPAYACLPNGPAQKVAFLLLTPQGTGSYGLDKEFSLDINIWSDNEAANLFKARLKYDPAYLEVVRIEKGSTLPNWVEEYFDNSTGTASLTAGIPSPGLKTSGNTPLMGKVIFKTKKYVNGATSISLTPESRIYSNSDNKDMLGSLVSLDIAIPFPPD